MIVLITEPPILDAPPVKSGGDEPVVETLGFGLIEVVGGIGTIPVAVLAGGEVVEVEVS